MLLADLKRAIREVPGFPRAGVNFYDVSTLFRNPLTFRYAVDRMLERYRGEKLDAVAGVEARGFVLAAAMAYELRTGLVLMRKPGKLPSEVEFEEYVLEYGSAKIEVHKDSVSPGQRILVVDDVLATGGTARAAGNLIERLGGRLEGYAFLVELLFLGGRKKLASEAVFSLLQYGEGAGL